jgi:hypothetical protein
MRIRIQRRGLTKFGVFLGAALGVIGGNYIWKPIFEEKFGTKVTPVETELKSENSD